MMMNGFLQDIAYTLRHLRRSPGFTLIAIVTLALGLGANTAMFTIINSALLRPLPYHDSDQLVRIFETYQPNGVGTVAPANFLDWRSQNVLAGMAAYRTGSRNIQTGNTPEHVTSLAASANLFDLLGTPVRLGRAFTNGDDEFGKPGVVVISNQLWRRDFDGKSDVIGQTIRIDGSPFTIIGVTAPGFQFPPNVSIDLWIPLQMSPRQAALRDTHFLAVIGRCKQGQTITEASTQLKTIVSRLAGFYPNELKGRSVKVTGLQEQLVGDIRPKLALLMGAVVVVLLIACANLANLLLARAVKRGKEVSIRVAIGASKARLVQQFLTESVVLAALGGGLGFLVGWIELYLVSRLGRHELPYLQATPIDWRVAGFLIALSLFTGMIFGLAPALHALRANVQGELREDLSSFRKSRLRNALVVGEVALSLVLLVSAGLLLRSFLRILGTQTGFDSNGIITMHVSVQPGMYSRGQEVTQLYEPILEKLTHLPGVSASGLTSLLPLQDWGTDGNFHIKNRPPDAPGQEPSAELRIVSADYFKTLKIPLISGRFFSAADNTGAPGVVIINEALAHKYFPGENPVGQILEGDSPRTIVGVAGDVRQIALDQSSAPELYYPDTQAAGGNWFLGDAAFVIRSSGDPVALVPEIRSAVRQIRADEPVFDVETMDEVVSKSLSDRTIFLWLLSLFSGLALALSAVGLYGLMSYAVSQRTREFGVRLALGAQHGQIFGLILREQARLTVAGILLGCLATFFATRFFRSSLFGVTPTDLLTFSVATVTILAAGLLASVVPAARAARTAPNAALRYQ